MNEMLILDTFILQQTIDWSNASYFFAWMLLF